MSKPMFSENAKRVIEYLKSSGDVTAADIAEALGLTPAQVNGTATGLQKKGITERVEVEGFEKKVIRLTPAGETADVDAVVE